MLAASPRSPIVVLIENEWADRRNSHEARVGRWIEPHAERARRQEKNPVVDFLFTYYSFRPSWIRRWHPGIGVALAGSGADAFLRWREYDRTTEGIQAMPQRLSEKRVESIQWIQQLLSITASRPAFFGCYGWHEWAMLYRARPEDIRHDLPLRMSIEDISSIVERQVLCCTHFDAFRHFMSGAQPLNSIQPSRPAVLENEQCGCLHVNMDLYKWATKLTPFVPSELLADCFELALRIREIDMRASPYDLQHCGYLAIKVETAEGRAEYVGWQKQFAEEGRVLRRRLLEVCGAITHQASAR